MDSNSHSTVEHLNKNILCVFTKFYLALTEVFIWFATQYFIPKFSLFNFPVAFLNESWSKILFRAVTKRWNKFVLSCLFMSTSYSSRRVDRNSQWGGGCFGSLGAKPPAARGWGFGGKAPSRRRNGGLGAPPPALESVAFFCKNNFILGLFWLKNNAFKTWLRNWQCKQD